MLCRKSIKRFVTLMPPLLGRAASTVRIRARLTLSTSAWVKPRPAISRIAVNTAASLMSLSHVRKRRGTHQKVARRAPVSGGLTHTAFAADYAERL